MSCLMTVWFDHADRCGGETVATTPSSGFAGVEDVQGTRPAAELARDRPWLPSSAVGQGYHRVREQDQLCVHENEQTKDVI